MRRRTSLLLATVVAGCIQDPSVPKIGTDPVSISLTVSSQTLRVGAADTIRVTVKNNLTQAVRITFDNVCQVYVTIRDVAGDVVTPRDGRPDCLPIQSQLNLAAAATRVYTSVWTGGFDFSPPDTQAKVPPGTYFVSAQLIALGYSTLAPAYRIDVVQ